jgi:hypothetical protein
MPQIPKLSKFQLFVKELVPHELEYLVHTAQFVDQDNIRILHQAKDIVKDQQHFDSWQLDIDKRKYSRLMQWMSEKLDKKDVDKDYAWLLYLEQQVMTDRISPKEETALVKRLKNYTFPCYNFMRLYQLAQQFGNFLMIRMRDDHQVTVQSFIEAHKLDYLRCRDTYQQLNDATSAIVGQYKGERMSTRHWESWLTSVFQNEKLDGLNRYAAIVRLTFLYYNYKDYRTLESLYEELDQCFATGLFYSKRILANYYSNRVLMHAQKNEWDKAEYYGLLSIKFKGADYIHYLNNLAAIWIRSRKYKTTLQYMQQAFPELKNTTSAHNKVGFVALYTKALNYNGQSAEALRYAGNYLEANREDVLTHRWHLFFTTYLQSMLFESRYDLLIHTIKKYQLLEKDRKYQDRSNYLPTIPWYYHTAMYKVKSIKLQSLMEHLVTLVADNTEDPHRQQSLQLIYQDIKKSTPEIPISLSSAIEKYRKMTRDN